MLSTHTYARTICMLCLPLHLLSTHPPDTTAPTQLTKHLPSIKIYRTESPNPAKARALDDAITLALTLLGYTVHTHNTHTLYNSTASPRTPDITIQISLEEQSATTYIVECTINDASSERSCIKFEISVTNPIDFAEAAALLAQNLRTQILGGPSTPHQHPHLVIKSADGSREICAQLTARDLLPIGQSYRQIFSVVPLPRGGFIACVDHRGERQIVYQPLGQPQRTLLLPQHAYYPQRVDKFGHLVMFVCDRPDGSIIGITPLQPLLETADTPEITYIPTTPRTKIQTSPTSNKHGRYILFLARPSHMHYYQIYSYNTITREVLPVPHNPSHKIVHILCSPEEQLLAAVIETPGHGHALALIERGQIVQQMALGGRCVDIRWAQDGTGLFVLTEPIIKASKKKDAVVPQLKTLLFVSRFNMRFTVLAERSRYLGIGT